MNTRRQKEKKPPSNQAPKVKKITFKDMQQYARSHGVPVQFSGFSVIPKTEVSKDIREILRLPLLSEEEAQRDELLASTSYFVRGSRSLSGEFRARLNNPNDFRPPSPEAPPLRGDERPTIIRAYETAVFNENYDEDSSDDDPLEVPPPSRAMSGWVSSRLLAESGMNKVIMESQPLGGHQFLSTTSSTFSSSTSSSSPVTPIHPNNVTLKPASTVFQVPGSMGVTFGWPRGAGLSVGMGPLRLDLSLNERLAAVDTRREERDERFMMKRRYYLQNLRNYHLESKEHKVALDQLRLDTIEARQRVHPGRSYLYATEEEEWIAVDRMVAAANAVYQQNKELRARLAAATWRHSGNVEGEPYYQAEKGPAVIPESGSVSSSSSSSSSTLPGTTIPHQAISSLDHRTSKEVVPLTNKEGILTGGGSRSVKNRHGGKSSSQSLYDDHDNNNDDDDPSSAHPPTNSVINNIHNNRRNNEDLFHDPYRLRTRSEPRRINGPYRYSGKDTVLALGDLVLTPFGRGVVIVQRDQPLLTHHNPEPIVEVLLPFGKGYLNSSQVILLATAGEEYTADLASDKEILHAALVPPLPKAYGLRASNAPIMRADDVLYGPKTGNVSTVPSVALPVTSSSSTSATIGTKSPGGRRKGKDISSPTRTGTTNVHAMDIDMSTPPSALSSSSSTTATEPEGVFELDPRLVRMTNGVSNTTKAGGGLANYYGHQISTSLDSSVIHNLHHGASTREMVEEFADETAAAVRTTRKIKPKSGIDITNRTPTFRTSIERNGIPRGVPLLIDPIRGTSTLGYIVSTLDGSVMFNKDGHITRNPQALLSNVYHGGDKVHDTGYGKDGDRKDGNMRTGTDIGMEDSGKYGSGASMVHATATNNVTFPTSSSSTTGLSSTVPPATTTNLRTLLGEKERLQYQLRLAEEKNNSHTKRLDDARNTSVWLLATLNDERARTTAIQAELERREDDIDKLINRIKELAQKYEPGSALANGRIPGIGSDNEDETDDDNRMLQPVTTVLVNHGKNKSRNKRTAGEVDDTEDDENGGGKGRGSSGTTSMRMTRGRSSHMVDAGSSNHALNDDHETTTVTNNLMVDTGDDVTNNGSNAAYGLGSPKHNRTPSSIHTGSAGRRTNSASKSTFHGGIMGSANRNRSSDTENSDTDDRDDNDDENDDNDTDNQQNMDGVNRVDRTDEDDEDDDDAVEDDEDGEVNGIDEEIVRNDEQEEDMDAARELDDDDNDYADEGTQNDEDDEETAEADLLALNALHQDNGPTDDAQSQDSQDLLDARLMMDTVITQPDNGGIGNVRGSSRRSNRGSTTVGTESASNAGTTSTNRGSKRRRSTLNTGDNDDEDDGGATETVTELRSNTGNTSSSMSSSIGGRNNGAHDQQQQGMEDLAHLMMNVKDGGGPGSSSNGSSSSTNSGGGGRRASVRGGGARGGTVTTTSTTLPSSSSSSYQLKDYSGKPVHVWIKVNVENTNDGTVTVWRDKHLGLRDPENNDVNVLTATPSLIFP